MKIGVLSDTHLRELDSARALAAKLLQGPFSEVEAILHAGDLLIPTLADCFAPLPWYGVQGNMDASAPELPISRVVRLVGKKIGLIHGWGPRENIEQRVVAHFAGEMLDAIVFGHSHQPVCRRQGGLLLFNPGSATDKRSAAHHTVGVLTLTGSVSGEIISID